MTTLNRIGLDTEKSKENTNDLKPTPFDVLKYVMEKLKHDHQNENLIDPSQNKVHHENDNKTATVSPSPIIPPNGDTLVIQTNQQHNKESNDNTMDNQEPQLAKDDTKGTESCSVGRNPSPLFEIDG